MLAYPLPDFPGSFPIVPLWYTPGGGNGVIDDVAYPLLEQARVGRIDLSRAGVDAMALDHQREPLALLYMAVADVDGAVTPVLDSARWVIADQGWEV